ncbi:MAG: phosphoribosyltransferase [Actinomycetota bacterium]
MTFRDRVDAGRRLAERLAAYRGGRTVVVALPRGGVPVAAEVARALDAPLDVLVVRKLGCPWQPELGMGAIAEGDITVLNEELIARIGADDGMIEAVADRERAELERRIRRYRGDRPPVPVEGRTVTLVDDGIATGSTARAAIDVLRRRGASRVVLAVPVAPQEAVVSLGAVADEVVAVEVPRMFMAIGQFYDDFSQTRDDEVAELLADRPTPSAGVH